MKGQLWEECWCGIEPVCANCMKCEIHCDCDKPKSTISFELFCDINKDTEDSIPHPAKTFRNKGD